MNAKRSRKSEGRFVDTTRTIERRKFLTTATGLVSAALVTGRAEAAASGPASRTSRDSVPTVTASPAAAGLLALDGGTPVRATKLRPNFPGPLYYDTEER